MRPTKRIRSAGEAGSDWIGADWIGADWTGLDWTVPDAVRELLKLE